MPRAGSKEEYESKQGGEYGLLPEDSYVFEVTGFKNEGVKPVPPQFNPDGTRTYTDIRFYAKPVQYADDPETPIVDAKTGAAINPDKSVQIFFKPEQCGFGPGGASKNRKFIAAATGQGLNTELVYEYEDAVGGRFIGDVEHKVTGKGTFDNIVDFRPIKANRDRPRPKPQESAVEAAKEAFDTVPEDDDDLPF
jgi:hypothetical protein